MVQDPFLKQVARKLYEAHGNGISEWKIVVPSHRAGMYFKYYLSELAATNLLSPDVMAMDEFAQRLSGLQLPDRVTLLFELFRTFRTYDPKSRDNLERFAPLGMVMLKDFNMIDMNLPEKKADQLFEYVEEVKAMERWAEGLGEGEPLELGTTSKAKDYFDFWKKLRVTFWQYRKKLLAQNQAYNGLAFRYCWHRLDELMEKAGWQKVVFAGFNQLTRVEEQIIEKLWKEGKAETYWDADHYYFENPQHEAGDYMRAFRKRWLPSNFQFQQDRLKQNPPKVRMVYAGDAVNQAKVVGELLRQDMEKMAQNGQWEGFKQRINHTGILMPDESLLTPLLYSLPETEWEGQPLQLADHVNITMGLSFKYTPLYTLIDGIFRMQENIREKEGQWVAWHKDVLKLLRHPFMQAWEGTGEMVAKVAKEVEENKRVLVSLDELNEWCGQHPAFLALFQTWEEQTPKAVAYFFHLIEALSKALNKDQFLLEQEFLLQFFTLLKRLHDVMEKYQERMELRTFKHFLYELFRSISVPFTGEPISPVQVMGTLESRALDFSHVYILSCNEGIFPQGKLLESLIPFDLRLEYKLPTHQENDASFSFTFHRLFHRAETVTLLYSSPSDKMGGGEKSRFLTQLEKESGWPIEHLQLEMDLPEAKNQERVIPKDEVVMQQLRQALFDGRSPSAINFYIRSPLEFYFKSVLKLGDILELEDTVDAPQFGNLIHETLDQLLKGHKGQEVTADMLLAFSKDAASLQKIMDAVIVEKMGNVVMDQGKNYILYQVAVELLQRFLRLQAETFAPFFLVDLEEYYSHTFQCPLPLGGQVPVRFSGKADRIDIDPKARTIRIVDYKTGTYQKGDLKAESWEDLLFKSEKGKVVQLMLYKYLLVKNLQSGQVENLPSDFRLEEYKVLSGFYFFRNLPDGFIEYTLKDEPTPLEEFCEYVEAFLTIFVQDVLNAQKPLTETPSNFGLRKS